eukprot:UN21242
MILFVELDSFFVLIFYGWVYIEIIGYWVRYHRFPSRT